MSPPGRAEGPATISRTSRSSGKGMHSAGGQGTDPVGVAPLIAALDALENGVNVLPPKQDGTKAPDGRLIGSDGKWQSLQQRRVTEDEIRGWYSDGRTGVGVVCGAISGGLEMLEFEGRAVDEGLEEQFLAAAIATGLGPLVQRISRGYLEMTPSGGYHVYYRCSSPKSHPLARRPSTPDELVEKPKQGTQVLIETKGEGGYSITSPTDGTVHPSGIGWVQLMGGWSTVATLTDEEHEALLNLSRTFDRMPMKQVRFKSPEVKGSRPGDVFNEKADWAGDVMEPAGWRHLFSRADGTQHWQRPDKTGDQASATVGHGGHDVLYVFSTSTPFPEVPAGYEKFAAYAYLHHGGDFTAAAMDLHDQGYGGGGDLDEDRRVQKEVDNLRVRDRASRQFQAEKRSTTDQLESRIADALMTLEADDAPADHTEGWMDETGIMALPPVDWVVKEVVQDGGATVIWGEPGIGKTFILLGLAKAVSRGKRWQNHPTQRGAVLFYESEGLQQFQDRISAFNSKYRWALGDSASLRFVAEPVDLTSIKGIAAVVRTGHRLNEDVEPEDRLRLVVIDPLIENMSGDENNEGMEALSRALRIIANELNCAVLAGHHSNASGERERGNAKLRARVLAMAKMERLADGMVGFVVEKQRNGRRIAIELLPTEHEGSLVLEWIEEMAAEDYSRRREERKEAAKEARQAGKSAVKDEKAEGILRDVLIVRPGIAKDALLNECLGKGIGKPALGRALDRMTADGVVRVEEGLRNAQLHHLT